MGVRQFFDGLINAISGQGTTTDHRYANSYIVRRLTDPQIDAAYRGSWLMRKIIDKPAKEMTRQWRDWNTDKEAAKKLKAEEKRLGLKGKFKLAEELRGLGGGAMILYVDGDDQMAPLKSESVRLGGLTAVNVWHRSCFSLGPAIDKWGDPWFGHPSYYEVRLQGASTATPQRFHPSRVAAFRGAPVSIVTGGFADDWWWGDSVVQIVKDAVDNVHTGEDGFASLIKDTRNRRVSIPRLLELVSSPDGESKLAKRMQALALGESMYGVTWLDGGDGDGKGAETIDDRQMVWAGIPDIKSSNLAVAAAAAGIPATVLLEKSPDGQNSTGASDLENWRTEIGSRQEVMQLAMDQVDAALIPSALGKVDPDVTWDFAPLAVQSEKDEATTFKDTMTGVDTLSGTGLVPTVALEKAVQNLVEERKWLPGLGDALAELPKDERFPSLSEPDPEDPSALQTTNGGKEAISPSAGAGDQPPNARRRAANDARFTDATPRTMYVQRKLLNADELIRWAKSQGFESTLPADDMHVTVAFSRAPIDWMKTGADWSGDEKGNLLVKPGGPRTVERMGDGDAIALQFTDDNLTWRHQRFIEAGASWDWPEYQPHITISWTMPRDFDVSKVEPYVGPLKFGPELFSEVDEDWKQSITEEDS